MPDKEEDIREGETPEDGVFSDSKASSRKAQEENKELMKQIQAERELSEKYKAPIRKKWLRQMKMMKNEKLNKEKIGDETMYTIFDTLYSALSNDKIIHKMNPTEMGDVEKAELIEAHMENDYAKMDMETTEDYWGWWSLFSGHAVLDMSEFNEKILSTAPIYINPFLDYPDPKALSLYGAGIKGAGSARFYGYEISTTVGDLKNMGIDTAIFDETSTAQKDLDNMNKLVPGKLTLGDNEDRSLLVWYTKTDGQWYRVYCTLDYKFIRKKAYSRLPLTDRITGIDPYEWYPRTVPDMLEDKHKAKANTMNIAMDNVREQQKSIYITTKNNLRLNALAEAQAGDILEAKNPRDIIPMQKDSIKQDVEWLLQKLDASSQEVSATPDIKQGVAMDEKRTLGELSLISSGSQNRYGAKARIIGRSMKLFWSIWYDMILENWDENIHQKVIKIAGVYGPQWITLRKPDIELAGDFDIRITTKIISDQKDAIERVNFMEFHKVASADPTYNLREGIKEIGRRSGLNTQKINFFIQKTTDEKEAEKENILLASNKLVDEKGDQGVVFHIRQNHEAHIREHMKNPDTEANRAHIKQHYEADIFLKNNPEMAQYIQPQANEADIARENANNNSIGQMVTPNNYTPGALPTL